MPFDITDHFHVVCVFSFGIFFFHDQVKPKPMPMKYETLSNQATTGHHLDQILDHHIQVAFFPIFFHQIMGDSY